MELCGFTFTKVGVVKYFIILGVGGVRPASLCVMLLLLFSVRKLWFRDKYLIYPPPYGGAETAKFCFARARRPEARCSLRR